MTTQPRWDSLRPTRADARPMYDQLVHGIRHLVATGAVPDGAGLPSLRDAAGLWGVNLHTVRRAYGELAVLGLVEIRGTRGVFVTARGTGRGASPFEDFIASVLRDAETRFDAGPEDVIDAIGRLADAAPAATAAVWVLECSRTFRDTLAEQIERCFRVSARGWDVARAESVPAGTVIGTYFHYDEVRTRLAARLQDVHFVSVHYEVAAIRRAAKAARASGKELLVCNRDPALTAVILEEIRASVPRSIRLRSVRAGRPGAALRGPERSPVLFTPPLWDELTESERKHPRAHPLRIEVDEPDLARLGRVLGVAAPPPAVAMAAH